MTLDKKDLKPISREFFHKAASHQCNAQLNKTAEKMGYRLTGKIKDCIHCARAKMKQKKIPKKADEEDLEWGTRIAMDITSCGEKSAAGNKYARVKIDYHTDKMFVSFLKTKDAAAEDGMKFIDDLVSSGRRPPKYIRKDRAGENRVMARMIKQKYPDTKIELTAKGMLQQNGKLERGIATVWSRVRAMMNGAGMGNRMRGKVWAEAWITAVEW